MRRIVLAAIAVVALLGLGFLLSRRLYAAAPGTFYGNVEIRQVDLAFNAEGVVHSWPSARATRSRRAKALAETGFRQLPRCVEPSPEARRDAAKAQLDLLLAGTRPEEIDPRPRQPRGGEGARCATQPPRSTARPILVKRDVTSPPKAYDDARMALDPAPPRKPPRRRRRWTRR